MVAGSTWISNAWYVAGWDAEIDTAPLARTICGVPMVFYRRLDRSVVAMREAQQQAIKANPELKLSAYRIDEGGTRSGQMIARAIKRTNAGSERELA